MSTSPAAPTGGPSSALRPLAVVSQVSRPPDVDHELWLMPGAAAEDVSLALVTIPASAVLLDHYGEEDLTLVFREAPRPARATGSEATFPDEAEG